MPPKVIKKRPPIMGSDRWARVILRERCSGRPLAEQEQRLDDEYASLVWSDEFGRMWRYIGLHMKEVKRSQ